MQSTLITPRLSTKSTTVVLSTPFHLFKVIMNLMAKYGLKHSQPRVQPRVCVTISTSALLKRKLIYRFTLTNFLKAIYCDDDRKRLQQSIDNLEKWSKQNFLTLNPINTTHVSYTRNKKRTNFNHYYIERDRIRHNQPLNILA